MVKAVRQRLDFIGPFDWAIMGILIGLFIGAVFGSRAAHAASMASRSHKTTKTRSRS
jgi:hypothetical protein